MSAPKVPIIVGPTAVGKTALALDLASKLAVEIVSADSRQVYRYLDIGTAKPTPAERAAVRHHFIDIRDPDQYFSAGEYGREARACIRQLCAAGVQPVVVGGSGFYLRALVDGLFAPEISDLDTKERIRKQIGQNGLAAVYQELTRLDPDSAQRIHPNDEQRIVRALEVYALTGKPISSYQAGTEEPADFTPIFIGLDRERQALYRRIEDRVDEMIAAGLVPEVEALRRRGFSSELNSLQTVGYQEIFSYLNGQLTLPQAIELIKQNSRRYAKRQLTWFRRDARVRWFDLSQVELTAVSDLVLVLLGTSG